jgi:hypothetical protein
MNNPDLLLALSHQPDVERSEKKKQPEKVAAKEEGNKGQQKQ